MSHFSVIVCIDNPRRLDEVMAQYDENREVAPYEDYEEGDATAYWAVDSLRKDAGLNPDDATLTWAQVAEAYNRQYGDEESPLIATGDGLRAYTISTRNPDAKWDYWRIGGRWGGYFPYRAECAAQVIQPESGWDSPGGIPALHCDGGPKSALDLAALRAEKEQEARKTFAEYAALTDGLPAATPWAEYVARVEAKSLTISEARDLYHAQPQVKALSASERFRWADDVIGTFGAGEDRYVATEIARAVPGYATIRMDGKWMAPGRMGWFGASTDGASDRIGYWEAANAYIESVPDSAYLVALDCHI
jgi:hypothetical protein